MRLKYVRMANFSFSTCGFLLESAFLGQGLMIFQRQGKHYVASYFPRMKFAVETWSFNRPVAVEKTVQVQKWYLLLW